MRCLASSVSRCTISLLLYILLIQTASAATFTVTNLADAGGGSLRQAMLNANGLAGADIIDFAPGVFGSIHLASPLPALQSADGDGTEIRGETADDVLGGPDILIDTSGAGGAGFVIQANNCVIRGLEVESANVAVDIIGSLATPAQGNVIGGTLPREQNVLRSGGIGVRLRGEGVTGNTLLNNQVFSNSGNGIELRVGASFNLIQKNFVFENNGNGILLLSDQGVEMHDNELVGNIVGLDPTGMGVLQNLESGIRLEGVIDILYNNKIMENLVSGNKLDGISIVGGRAFDNSVSQNQIGVDATGTNGLGNEQYGVHVSSGAHLNVIGPGNLISGNAWDGVMLDGAGTDQNSVTTSTIGLDISGTVDLGNGRSGVNISSGAKENTVSGCVISANGDHGVLLFGGGTDLNTVHDNLIGTDASGSASHPNGGPGEGGVLVWEGPTGCEIGPNNVVAAHGQVNQFGIKLWDVLTQGNYVYGNVVGLNSSQSAALANYDGIVDQDAPLNEIGPDNVVSGNLRWGILVQNTTDVAVFGNTIGTDITESSVFPNQSGIRLETGNCTVGGDPGAGMGNVICGNNHWGIEAQATSAAFTAITIQGNWIGETTSSTSMPNGDGGIWMANGIQESLIGDPVNTSLGNKILHNGPLSVTFGQGVLVGEVAAVITPVGVRILGNSISDNGTDGIGLIGAANNSITPPIINVATTWQASGTTGLPGTIATVQVFHDNADEGLTYVDETTSDAAGNWSVTFAVPISPGGNLTATNTADWIPGTTVHTSEFSIPVAVDALSDAGGGPELPATFSVELSSPNPTRGMAHVAFAAPHESHVVAYVFDVRGKLVREVVNRSLPAGVHQIVWDGTSSNGATASSGRYFFDVRFESRREVRQITLIR